MRLKAILASGVILAAMPTSPAHADVRVCTPAELTSADDGFSPPDAEGRKLYHRDTNEIHPRFHLKTIVYNRPLSGAPSPMIGLILKANGYVECLDAAAHQAFMLSPQRRALLRNLQAWRFDPIRVAGKPVRAIIYWYIPEKIDFHFHEDMPKAPLADMSVTLERSLDWPAPSKETLTVRGDGRVDYEASGLFSDAHGHHSWRVTPAEVAALFDKLRADDVWSAAGSWQAVVIDAETSKITLTVGQQSRVIYDLGGVFLGMPATVNKAEDEIDAVAADLIHLTPRGLAILDDEGFDFKSPLGADLLARVSADTTTTEDTALALLDRGAPPDGGHIDSVAQSDGHDFPRHVQTRHWPHVIAWLNAHGYGPFLDAYKPNWPGYSLDQGLPPPPQKPGSVTYSQPWMKSARKWY